MLIVGHGPNSAEDYAPWMSNLRVVADSVKARGGFRISTGVVSRDTRPG